MITVTVKWLVDFSRSRGAKGDERFILPLHATFPDLLKLLSETFGEAFTEWIYEAGSKNLREDLYFLLNGKNIELYGIEFELKDGDRLFIMPILAGG